MKHIVIDGDCIESIAAQYGIDDSDVIMNHPQNAALKKIRPDGNQLHPDDELFIPPPKPKSYVLETGKRHRIMIKRPRRLLRMRFLDDEDKPMTGPYTLKAGAWKREGALDGDGVLEEKLPVDIKQAEVTIDEMTQTILIGYLNPMAKTKDEGVSGAQARLLNLGFDPGEVNGEMSSETRAAIEAFQDSQGLEVTGELDDDTINKLADRHGC